MLRIRVVFNISSTVNINDIYIHVLRCIIQKYFLCRYVPKITKYKWRIYCRPCTRNIERSWGEHSDIVVTEWQCKQFRQQWQITSVVRPTCDIYFYAFEGFLWGQHFTVLFCDSFSENTCTVHSGGSFLTQVFYTSDNLTRGENSGLLLKVESYNLRSQCFMSIFCSRVKSHVVSAKGKHYNSSKSQLNISWQNTLLFPIQG